MSTPKKYTESLAEIKRKYTGLIIFDTAPIDIFKDYFLRKSKNGYGVDFWFYAIPIEKLDAFIKQQKEKSADFKKGAEQSDDDWALRFLAKKIWSKNNSPKDISTFMNTVGDTFYENDHKSIRFEQGGSTSTDKTIPTKVVSEEEYNEMLDAVPPHYISTLNGIPVRGFAVGEAYGMASIDGKGKYTYHAYIKGEKAGTFKKVTKEVYFSGNGVAHTLPEGVKSFKEGGSTTTFKTGDLVFVKDAGRGLVGLVISDTKTEDEETGNDVYFRGLRGEEMFVPVNEMKDVLDGYAYHARNNGDFMHYPNIAKKLGIELNPKYNAAIEGDEEEYKEGGNTGETSKIINVDNATAVVAYWDANGEIYGDGNIGVAFVDFDKVEIEIYDGYDGTIEDAVEGVISNARLYKQGGSITIPKGKKWNEFKAEFIDNAKGNGALKQEQAEALFQDFIHIMVKEFNKGESGYDTWYAHSYQYAVEYRDMHTAIHNLIATKYPDKAKAQEILDVVNALENADNEEDMEAFSNELSNMEGVDDTFEINFREIQDINGGKFWGDAGEIMIINNSVPDLYEKGGAVTAKQYEQGGSTLEWLGGKSSNQISGYGKDGFKNIVEFSKKYPKNIYIVTDDNYSHIGKYWLKNGKFAKRDTIGNPNYDLTNRPVRLSGKDDVIYKLQRVNKENYYEQGGSTGTPTSIILKSYIFGMSGDKNDYRAVLDVNKEEPLNSVFRIERNFERKGEWDKTPGRWYIGTLLNKEGYHGTGTMDNVFTIDGGTDWKVRGAKSAIEEAEDLLGLKSGSGVEFKIPIKKIILKDSNEGVIIETNSFAAADKALHTFWAPHKNSDAYYELEWEDGETLSGSIDLEPNDFHVPHKDNILTWHIKTFWNNVAKATPKSYITQEEIDEAKNLVANYMMVDSVVNTPAAKQSASKADFQLQEAIRLVKMAENGNKAEAIKELEMYVKQYKDAKQRGETQMLGRSIDKIIKEYELALETVTNMGTTIENQYTGKTPEQVWNAWTPEQRDHFLEDHKNKMDKKPWANFNFLDKATYSTLPESVKKQLIEHIADGQYEQGGSTSNIANPVLADFLPNLDKTQHYTVTFAYAVDEFQRESVNVKYVTEMTINDDQGEEVGHFQYEDEDHAKEDFYELERMGYDIEEEYKQGGSTNWISGALSGGKNKGALRRTAMRHGLLRNDKEKLSLTDLHKLQNKRMSPTTQKRAHLAETLRKFDDGGSTNNPEVPEEVYWALYALDRRFVDTELTINRTGENSFNITNSEGLVLIIEKQDEGTNERKVFDWLTGTTKTAIGFYEDGGEVNAELDNYIASLPKFATAHAYQKWIRENNKLLDHVVVNGIVFTQDDYDSEGKEVTYGNKKEGLTMTVETSDRYGYSKFSDAKVNIDKAYSFRNDINYLMAKGGEVTDWQMIHDELFFNWDREEAHPAVVYYSPSKKLYKSTEDVNGDKYWQSTVLTEADKHKVADYVGVGISEIQPRDIFMANMVKEVFEPFKKGGKVKQAGGVNELKGYSKLISEATGITDQAKLDQVEDMMRHTIFQSTLSWQTKRQFNKGAREAVQVLNALNWDTSLENMEKYMQMKKGGSVTAPTTVLEYLSSINCDALVKPACDYLRDEMLGDDYLNLLSLDNTDVQTLQKLIEERFPQALQQQQEEEEEEVKVNMVLPERPEIIEPVAPMDVVEEVAPVEPEIPEDLQKFVTEAADVFGFLNDIAETKKEKNAFVKELNDIISFVEMENEEVGAWLKTKYADTIDLKFAKGGEVDQKYKLELVDWSADVYEDDYEQGEGAPVNFFSGEVHETFDSIDDMIKYINDKVIFADFEKSDFSVNDDGRIDTSVLVAADNSKASGAEIEKWKKGELKLYSANYSFNIILVSQKTPTADELSELLGIKMKKGGTVTKKKFGDIDTTNFDEVYKAYATAMLWSEYDGDDALDANYNLTDIDEKSEQLMRSKIMQFLTENPVAITKSGLSNEQIGHSLWLTQNHHGAGFFDYSLEKSVEDKLIKGAHALGQGNPEVADGKIYVRYDRAMKSGGSIFDEPHSGRYLELIPSENGLTIKLNEEGKEKAAEDGLTEQNFWDYFEDIQVNSEYMYHADMGNAGFGLTSAPGITEGYYFDDDSELTNAGHDNTKVYWYEPYQVSDFTEKLLTDGEVFFQKEPYDDDGEKKKKGGKVKKGKKFQYAVLRRGVYHGSVEMDTDNASSNDAVVEYLTVNKFSKDLIEKVKSGEDKHWFATEYEPELIYKGKYDEDDYNNATQLIEGEFNNSGIDEAPTKLQIMELAVIIADLAADDIPMIDIVQHNKVQDYLSNLAASYKTGKLTPQYDKEGNLTIGVGRLNVGNNHHVGHLEKALAQHERAAEIQEIIDNTVASKDVTILYTTNLGDTRAYAYTWAVEEFPKLEIEEKKKGGKVDKLYEIRIVEAGKKDIFLDFSDYESLKKKYDELVIEKDYIDSGTTAFKEDVDNEWIEIVGKGGATSKKKSKDKTIPTDNSAFNQDTLTWFDDLADFSENDKSKTLVQLVQLSEKNASRETLRQFLRVLSKSELPADLKKKISKQGNRALTKKYANEFKDAYGGKIKSGDSKSSATKEFFSLFNQAATYGKL